MDSSSIGQACVSKHSARVVTGLELVAVQVVELARLAPKVEHRLADARGAVARAEERELVEQRRDDGYISVVKGGGRDVPRHR
jgi:hypothetical protein